MFTGAENTQVLNAEWFEWYSGQYVLTRNIYRIYNRSAIGKEIVLDEEYNLLDDAVDELINLIEYDPSVYEMGVYKIRSGMEPGVSLEVRYKHKTFSGNNPEAVKMADEKSYDRWNKDYLIDEPDDFLVGATDLGDIVSEVFVASESKIPKCQNCDNDRHLYCPQCHQPTCKEHYNFLYCSCRDCFSYLKHFMSESELQKKNKIHFMDPKRRLRRLIKDVNIDPETASKRISFNADNSDEKIYSYNEMKAVFDKAAWAVPAGLKNAHVLSNISSFWWNVRKAGNATIVSMIDRKAPRYSQKQMETVRRVLDRHLGQIN